MFSLTGNPPSTAEIEIEVTVVVFSHTLSLSVNVSRPVQVPMIVKALHKQLKEKSVKTRQCCFNMLTELVNVLPGALTQHIPVLIPGNTTPPLLLLLLLLLYSFLWTNRHLIWISRSQYLYCCPFSSIAVYLVYNILNKACHNNFCLLDNILSQKLLC